MKAAFRSLGTKRSYISCQGRETIRTVNNTDQNDKIAKRCDSYNYILGEISNYLVGLKTYLTTIRVWYCELSSLPMTGDTMNPRRTPTIATVF